jgi:5-bromo-4-chloroindolyl phosphate hydrolysis protein
MLKDGKLALSEMQRLDDNIQDEKISADIQRLKEVCSKIFDQVKADPTKLPQIRKFMDYYLPTTLKLLNSYDRMSETGVSGENIDGTLLKVEGMMRNIVAAFEKQLDSLYGAEALDISADITVLETMMAREGLTGQPLQADAVQTDPMDIKLEL